MRFLCDKDQGSSQDRDCHQQKKRNLQIDRSGHDPCQHDHDRRSGQHSDRKHKCHLHVCDIRGQPGHQTGC